MKVCLVTSSGGHLTETLQIVDAFADDEIFFVTWTGSREEDVRAIAPAYFIDSYGTNPLRLLASLPQVIRILLVEKPDVIVSLGAEIALPFFYLAKPLGIKTVFIESWCRIDGLSKTGKLVYPIADTFYVQWPQLLDVCGPKARYEGAVI